LTCVILDLLEEYVEDGRGGPAPVMEEGPGAFGHREDSLAHGHVGKNVVHQVIRGLGHALGTAGGTGSSALAGETGPSALAGTRGFFWAEWTEDAGWERTEVTADDVPQQIREVDVGDLVAPLLVRDRLPHRSLKEGQAWGENINGTSGEPFHLGLSPSSKEVKGSEGRNVFGVAPGASLGSRLGELAVPNRPPG
jgi:hypothetical protein